MHFQRVVGGDGAAAGAERVSAETFPAPEPGDLSGLTDFRRRIFQVPDRPLSPPPTALAARLGPAARFSLLGGLPTPVLIGLPAI